MKILPHLLMNLRLHPVPTIVEAPLHALVEQRRIARIASGAALAAAVHAGLHLPVVWSAEPREASETHFEKLARAVPADIDVIYGIGGGLAAERNLALSDGILTVAGVWASTEWDGLYHQNEYHRFFESHL